MPLGGQKLGAVTTLRLSPKKRAELATIVRQQTAPARTVRRAKILLGLADGIIASRRIRRGSFRSVNELIRAIMGYIKDHNRNPKRFVWTKRASTVIRRVNRSKAIYGTGH
jgi:hypothetical protein